MPRTIAETFDQHWRAAPGPLDTPCHIWQRRLSFGYGKTGDDWAHRESWRRARGAIPDELCVLHRCDVPACVNPDHLFLGTKGDNIRDAAAKNRTCKGDRHWTKIKHTQVARGSRHGRSRLTEFDVPRFFDLRRCGATQEEIASWFGVSRSLVSLILGGRKWSHMHRHVTCPGLRGGSGTNRGAARHRQAERLV